MNKLIKSLVISSVRAFFNANKYLSELQNPAIDMVLSTYFKKIGMDPKLIPALVKVRRAQTAGMFQVWDTLRDDLCDLIQRDNLHVLTFGIAVSNYIDNSINVAKESMVESMAVQFDHMMPGMHEAAKAQKVENDEIRFVN